MHQFPIMMGLVLLSSGAFSLDLAKTKFPLYYECHYEKSAGLSRESRGAEIRATVFTINRSDKWQMRVDKLDRKNDLTKYEKTCAEELSKRAISAPWIDDFANNAAPKFCVTSIYASGSEKIESSTFCNIFSPERNNSMLECGSNKTFYFDTDRLTGIIAQESLLAFHMGYTKTATMSEMACIRLDR